MIQFLNPLFLWGLAGLTIPVAIHLLSRKEGKIIRLGSLRHIHETSTQQFKGFRLNEIVLLCLRSLLIITLSLLLSGLHWNISSRANWVLVEKGLEHDPAVKQVVDSLRGQEYELRWLSNDFPLLDDSAKVNTSVNYWRLVNQLVSKRPDNVIVFAQNKINGFKGLRCSLPANIQWISQSPAGRDYTLSTVRAWPDTLAVRKAHTDANETFFITDNFIGYYDPPGTQVIKTITVELVSEEKYAYDKKILQAAFGAINKSFPIEIRMNIVPAQNLSSTAEKWLFWLSGKPLPEESSRSIRIHSELANNLLVEEKKDRWIFTKRLDEEVALRENMTLELAAILLRDEQLMETARQKDLRMLPDLLAWSAREQDAQRVEAGLSTDPANSYLLLLFLLLLIAERALAYRRNQ